MDATGRILLLVLPIGMGTYVFVFLRRRHAQELAVGRRFREATKGLSLARRRHLSKLLREARKIDDPAEANLVRLHIDSTEPFLRRFRGRDPIGLRKVWLGLLLLVIALAPFAEHGFAILRSLAVMIGIGLVLHLLTRRLLVDRLLRRYERTRAANGWEEPLN